MDIFWNYTLKEESVNWQQGLLGGGRGSYLSPIAHHLFCAVKLQVSEPLQIPCTPSVPKHHLQYRL